MTRKISQLENDHVLDSLGTHQSRHIINLGTYYHEADEGERHATIRCIELERKRNIFLGSEERYI
jgi:hypothetical protein